MQLMTGATGGHRGKLKSGARGGTGRPAALWRVGGRVTGLKGRQRDPAGGGRVGAGGDASRAAPLRLVVGGQTGFRGGGRGPGSRLDRWLDIEYALGATPGVSGVQHGPNRGQLPYGGAMQRRRGSRHSVDMQRRRGNLSILGNELREALKRRFGSLCFLNEGVC